MGSFNRCPIALIRENSDWLPAFFRAYAYLRRFNLLVGDVEPDLLLAFDDEIRKIEAAEREDRKKQEELRRKTAKNGHAK